MTTPITQDRLTDFRSQLEKRQGELRIELHDVKSAPVRTESDSQDIEQAYANDQDQEVDEEIHDQHVLELRDIEAALQRMDAGQYGICQDCDTAIDIKRLSAYPVARRCLKCKQALEQAATNARIN